MKIITIEELLGPGGIGGAADDTFKTSLNEYKKIKKFFKSGEIAGEIYGYLNGDISYLYDDPNRITAPYSKDYDKVKIKFKKQNNSINWFFKHLIGYIQHGHISDLKKFCNDFWKSKFGIFNQKVHVFGHIIISGNMEAYDYCLGKGILTKDITPKYLPIDYENCPSFAMIKRFKLKMSPDYSNVDLENAKYINFSAMTDLQIESLILNPDVNVVKYGVSKSRRPKTYFIMKPYTTVAVFDWCTEGLSDKEINYHNKKNSKRTKLS